MGWIFKHLNKQYRSIKTSQPHPEVPGIKRPVLPAKDTDEDELVTKFLYDYQSIHSW